MAVGIQGLHVSDEHPWYGLNVLTPLCSDSSGTVIVYKSMPNVLLYVSTGLLVLVCVLLVLRSNR